MVRRGGPGASCSARSSAARSWSTGLRTSCPSRQLSVALGELRSPCDGLAGLAAIVLEGLAAYVLVLLFVLLASVALEGVALFLLAGGSILVRLLAGDADAVGELDNDAGSSIDALVRSPLASVAVLVPGAVRLRAVFAVGVRYLYGGEADE
eukprot:5638905-Prymnesium_polylepis.1